MLFKSTLIMIVCLTHFTLFANERIKQFDVKLYQPRLVGLRDLVVDLKIPSLIQQINEKYVFGKIADIRLRLYWSHPNKAAAEVIGLPEGYSKVKKELEQLGLQRLEIILPEKFEKKLEGYSFKDEKEKVVALDKENLKDIPEFWIYFDQGLVNKLIARKPVGTITSNFEYELKENKYVMKGMKIQNVEGRSITNTENILEYEKIQGFYLPIRLKSSTTQKLVIPGEKEERERKFEDEIEFLDYKVNMELAKKFFRSKP